MMRDACLVAGKLTWSVEVSRPPNRLEEPSPRAWLCAVPVAVLGPRMSPTCGVSQGVELIVVAGL
jgi:hypothetical protein